jgi:competence protein ComEC
VNFVMMPALMAALLLMPLHLEHLALGPLQDSITLMLKLAHFIAVLPGAQLHTPRMTQAGFACVIAGGLWLALWRKGWRWLGVPLMLAGLLTMRSFVTPDMLLSDDGRYAAVKLSERHWALLRGRESGFLAHAWAQAVMAARYEPPSGPVSCDADGCIFMRAGRKVAFPDSQAALTRMCQTADMLVPGRKQDASGCKAAQWLTRDEGNLAVTLAPGGLHVVSVKRLQGDRRW